MTVNVSSNMNLNISVASRDRLYSKAMRRIRPAFTKLQHEVASLKLTSPGFESFLIGLADESAEDGVKVVFTDTQTRQVMIGLGPYSKSETDASLFERSMIEMIEALRLIDVEDEGDFRKLLSVFETHQRFRS